MRKKTQKVLGRSLGMVSGLLGTALLFEAWTRDPKAGERGSIAAAGLGLLVGSVALEVYS